jgi:hypothetical protein
MELVLEKWTIAIGSSAGEANPTAAAHGYQSPMAATVN